MGKAPTTIMCVGKSHSGKTSVAQLLAPKINFNVLDVDAIDLFTKDNYPQIVDFERTTREFYNTSSFRPLLKLKIQTTVFKYSLSNGMGIILSNGNLNPVLRSYQRKIATAQGSPMVIVHFEVSNEVLFERVKTSEKTTKTLTVSKSLEEMLQNQINNFVPPTMSEADYLLRINATEPINVIVDQVCDFLDFNHLL